jgi:hypothetical protein
MTGKLAFASEVLVNWVVTPREEHGQRVSAKETTGN